MLDSKITKLSDVCNGRLEKQFLENLEKCLENIVDGNYPHEAKREIKLSITLEPKNKNVIMSTTAECKLPKKASEQSIVFVDRDNKNQLTLFSSDPNQMKMFSGIVNAQTKIKGE